MDIEKVYLLYYSGFEWSLRKSRENKKKHGISFWEALEVWQNTHLTVEGIAYSHNGEERSATLGLVSGVLYTAIWTRRSGRIRLISVRRAREHEQEVYKKKVFHYL